MDYSSQDKINETIKYLNDVLWDNLNNRVLVLDFSHFSPKSSSSDEYDIHIKFIADSQLFNSYRVWISEQVRDVKAKWRFFPSEKKLLTTFGNKTTLDSKLLSPKKFNYRIVKSPIVRNSAKVESDFEPITHLVPYVKDENIPLPGECFVIFSQLHGKAQSILYLLLEKKLIDSEGDSIFEFSALENSEIDLDSKQLLKKIDDALSSLLTGEMVDSLVNEKSLLIQDVIKLATRAAISQVMARNMSHNMGSHVLSKVTSYKSIFELATGVEENVRQNYMPEDWVLIPEDKFGNDGEIEKNGHLERIALFNSYLRNRMDYLADIATGVPAMEVTRKLCGNVLMEMLRNKIMLDRISGVDGFPFKVVVKDCRACPSDCMGKKCKEVSPKDDIPLSVPNDIYGNHALYVIIENLIRNTAKHGGGAGEVIFTLRIKQPTIEASESVYEVLLYDNVKLDNKIIIEEDDELKTKIAEDIPNWEEEYLDEENEIKKIDWLVFRQNDRLNQSVLDEKTNRLRHGSWGLIEMDVSAGYLRKIPPEEVDSDDYDISKDPKLVYNPKLLSEKKLNILKAVNVDECLGYRFYLMKPKEMLIIDEVGLFNLNTVGKPKLEEYGILILNKNQFDKKEVYPHPFCLVIAGDSFDLDNYYFNPRLPTRLLVCKDKSSKSEISRHKVYLHTEDELIEAIKKVRVEREEGKNNSIMDLAWKSWLSNKVNYFKTPLFNPRYLSKILDFNNKNTKSKGAYYWDFADHRVKQESFEYNEYYEVFRSINEETKKKIKSVKNADLIEQFKFLDGLFTRIIIFDERIQKAADEPYDDSDIEIDIRQLLGKVNVLVPEADIVNLNERTFTNSYLRDMQGYIGSTYGSEGGKYIKGVDFVVIHLGVIEKALTALGKNKEEPDVRWFINKLSEFQSEVPADSEVAPDEKFRIVVTSGRGQPDNLPSEIPYIGFSILSQYCIENRFKTFLNQAIQAARIVQND